MASTLGVSVTARLHPLARSFSVNNCAYLFKHVTSHRMDSSHFICSASLTHVHRRYSLTFRIHMFAAKKTKNASLEHCWERACLQRLAAVLHAAGPYQTHYFWFAANAGCSWFFACRVVDGGVEIKNSYPVPHNDSGGQGVRSRV